MANIDEKIRNPVSPGAIDIDNIDEYDKAVTDSVDAIRTEINTDENKVCTLLTLNTDENIEMAKKIGWNTLLCTGLDLDKIKEECLKFIGE